MHIVRLVGVGKRFRERFSKRIGSKRERKRKRYERFYKRGVCFDFRCVGKRAKRLYEHNIGSRFRSGCICKHAERVGVGFCSSCFGFGSRCKCIGGVDFCQRRIVWSGSVG